MYKRQFDEWRDRPEAYDTHRFTHVVTPFPIPSYFRRYRAFDFGYARPFAVLWFGVDSDGTAYLYREWYGGSGNNVGMRLPASEIAKGIRRIEEEAGERDVAGFADPSIWDGSRGESLSLIHIWAAPSSAPVPTKGRPRNPRRG